MLRKLEVAPFYLGALACLFICGAAHAQVRPGGVGPALITQRVDERNLVLLHGSTRRDINPRNDRGAVPDDFMMEHMLLQLRRSSEQERALQQLIDELHREGSPNFHRWISAQEFGQRFGLAKQDLDTITTWLQSHGFQINSIYPSGMVIDFSGTARQVRQAFHTPIHHMQVKGEQHIANVNDPQIPAALAPAIVGVVSLNDVRPVALHRMHKPRSNYTFDSFGATYAMVPADLATIYNLSPLFGAGFAGQGQTIVLVEDTNVYSAADWTTFRSTFGLSHYSSASFKTVHPGPSSGPNNCGNPGVIAPDDAEAILDAEWASAAAPGAALQIASCSNTTTTFGGLIAVENLINSNSQPPAIMSISYGQCETENGASANAAYNSVYQQAVVEGVSIFVAAGDSGAAACDNNVSEATHGVGANAFASTPYNVAVGGTDFSDTYSGTNNLYWNSTNTSTFASALSYIPEIPWNNSCAGQLVSNYEGYTSPYGANGFCNSEVGAFLQTTVAGGGGPSGCATGTPSIAGVVSGSCAGWPKPSWQSILGNPNDGVRDTPDVSLFAADGLWSHYYVFCWSDTANGGAACAGAPSGWSGAGGTSFASPIMAGVQALINQKSGSRQGNPNPEYYHLAANEYGSNGSSCNSSNGAGVSSACIFYDVTQGDMDVNCAGPNCYQPSGPTGVLSTSNQAYNPAYGTGGGWDFATGIGSINAANLVNSWPNTAPGFTLSASPNSLNLTQGTSVTSTIGVTQLNGFGGNVSLSVSGLPSGVTASFSPNPATTSSVLTLTAASTAATGRVTLTITGTSGSLTSSTTAALAVTVVGNFALSASPTSLSVTQGAKSTTAITVAPQNGFSSSVSLSASGLPSGVTPSFSPNPATASSTLTLTATATATTGTFPVKVTGTVGGLTNSTTVSVTVSAAPKFTLSASPSSLGIPQGASGTSTITVTPQNGFNSGVSLSAFGLPSGVTALFSPNPATGSSTLALMASTTATTGTTTVTVTGTSGTLTYSTTVALTVISETNFASGWLDGDVGSVGLAGSATFANETFTVNGSGQQIWGNADSFNFAYQILSGDGSIVARVVSISPTSATPGVMIRDSLNANAMSAFGAYFASNAYLNYRTTTGGGTSQGNAAAGSLPYWLKLSRSGSTVSAFTSLDGVNWAPIGSPQTIPMGQNVYIGLAVCANGVSPLATATFDNVSVNSTAAPAPLISSVSATTGSVGSQVVISGAGFGAAQSNSIVTLNGAQVAISSWSSTSITITIPAGATSGPLSVLVAPSMDASNPIPFNVTAQPLPAPWLDQDVGQVGIVGSASFANGTFTVKGAGSQVWNNADSFHFVYQPLSGDGSIIARVVSISPLSATPGIMIRDSLNPGAMSAFGAYFASNAYLNYRTTTGGSTSQGSAAAGSLPYWLKLSRSGSSVSAYTSADGINWVPIGATQTIPMGQNVYIGLALTSNNGSTLATATYDNVSVNSTAAPAPIISSVSATAGPVGSQVVISGTAFGAAQGNSMVTLNGAPVTINSWSNSSITITIPAGATSGPLIVSVAPGMNNSNPVMFTVTVAVATYTLSASPSSVSIVQGATGTSTITVTPQNGFNGSVSLSASGLPSGVTPSFSPNPATASSTLTLTASSTAATGTTTVTVTGTSGTLTNSTTLSVTVSAAPTFTLSSSPTSLSILQGANGTSTITVTPQNGFNSGVSLSAFGLPSGVTPSFSPNPATASSTLTLTASSTATTGTTTVTVTGTSGTLTNSTTLVLTVTAASNTTLPSLWTDGDVGSVGLAGSVAFANGTFTVNGSGQQIWGNADSFNFAYQILSGDGSIVARVVSISPTSATPGVMIRDSLNANAMSAFGAYFASNAYLNYRTTTGGGTSQGNAAAGSLPYWLKLSRSGSTVSAFTSLDGVNWAPIGSPQTIPMGQNVYIGLAVCANGVSPLATATFDNVSVNSTAAPAPLISSVSATTGSVGSQVVISGAGFAAAQSNSIVTLNGAQVAISSWSSTSITITIPAGATSGPLSVLVAPSMDASNPIPFNVTAQPLPAPWLDQDVGQVGIVGSASFANGTFTVKGAGSQVWNNADSFHFVYQPLSGDGSIIARVVSISPLSATPGIMIRDSLNPGAMSAFGAYFASNAYLNYRTTTGGSTSQGSAAAGSLPYWLKLSRSGSSVSAYTSADGINWVLIGATQTIPMGQNVYIGLALTSNNGSTLATATYDNVSVN